jgi:magnesium chelatase subunit I
MGGNLKFSDTDSAATLLNRMEAVQGLLDKADVLDAHSDSAPGLRAAAGEMILEGLHATDKITRSEERGFSAPERSKGAAQDLYRDYQMERSRYKKPLN